MSTGSQRQQKLTHEKRKCAINDTQDIASLFVMFVSVVFTFVSVAVTGTSSRRYQIGPALLVIHVHRPLEMAVVVVVAVVIVIIVIIVVVVVVVVSASKATVDGTIRTTLVGVASPEFFISLAWPRAVRSMGRLLRTSISVRFKPSS
jgi:uncharacterized paraquat-inducible protein A